MESNGSVEEINQEQVASIDAENVDMAQSCSVSVLADKVDMNTSCAGIVRADTVHMKDSFALVLSSDNIEGDAKVLMSPTSAIIAGGLVLLGFLLFKRR